jgi:hypothetical protein
MVDRRELRAPEGPIDQEDGWVQGKVRKHEGSRMPGAGDKRKERVFTQDPQTPCLACAWYTALIVHCDEVRRCRRKKRRRVEDDMPPTAPPMP